MNLAATEVWLTILLQDREVAGLLVMKAAPSAVLVVLGMVL